MNCNHCRMNAEKALRNVDGVTDVTVDLATNEARITGNPNVDALRKAKESNPNVSGEVTVHHLLLNEEDIDCDNGKWKMNPPLRSK